MMLTANRKGFRMMPAISDNEIFGIGLVSFNWAALENLIELLNATATAEQQVNYQRSSFVERVQRLKKEAKAQLNEKWATRLTSALDMVLSVKGHRDQVVHWMWSEDKDGNPGVSNMGSPRFIERRIDYGKLKEIALQIDRSHTRIWDIFYEAGLELNPSFTVIREIWPLMRRG
ncbi:hypothetical protein SAMN05428967_4490 [Phyllobacterium sp. YR620]|uniref:hypothetical protein n=1 Tax=Phyllobacterium sp. YR620 TaxID=1881066 RepID=UPI000884DE92|nr:hypothetical protein [Phyllobacterium sp. YR620]SDP92640.1 hypothetical protein SAMN05428967_4490 [Phyllobacterium sp. YR620]